MSRRRVTVRPMPESWRSIPRRLWPAHFPVFHVEEPTADDVRTVLVLFEALDETSKQWYGGDAFVTGMNNLLEELK